MYALTALVPANGYYVKAARLFSPVRVPGQKPCGRTGDSILFLQCDGVGSAAMAGIRPVLDLHKDKGRVIFQLSWQRFKKKGARSTEQLPWSEAVQHFTKVRSQPCVR